MRRNLELLAAVVDAILEGIVVCDTNRVIVGINKPIETMFGYTRDELIGKKLTMLIPENIRQEKVEEMIELKDNENYTKVGHVIDTNALRKDGSIFSAGVSLSLTKMAAGDIYYISLVRDITERKAKEKRIQQLNDILSTRVEALEAFQYTVCHDLNAPLRSLEGFTEALKEDYSSCLDGTGSDYLKRIVSATHRMRHLVNDMLRLSQVTRPDIELIKEDFDMSLAATKIFDDFKVIDANRKVEVVIQPNMVVKADGEFLEIAIYNMLSNAWKFTKNKDEARIEFGSMSHDDTTVYYIRDNGAGFDMSKYDKLFQPFKRLHDRKDFEGNGIGLTIVKRVIELHEGRVWAEGKVGEGATFYFTVGKTNA